MAEDDTNQAMPSPQHTPIGGHPAEAERFAELLGHIVHTGTFVHLGTDAKHDLEVLAERLHAWREELVRAMGRG